jgi:hypothetical protein
MLRSFRTLKVLWLTFLVAVPVAVAQPGRPAVEYRSLLNVAFAEADGELLVGGLHIVFPPPGYEQAQLTVSTAAGEEIASVPLRLDSYLSFPVFGRFVPETNPTAIKLTKPGDYVLTVKIVDDAITRLPFTIGAEPNENPYDPPKRFWREGPWRDFGYLSLPASNTAGNVRFNWWMSLRELPIGMTNPSITIHLLENFMEVGVSREPLRLERRDWQFFSAELAKTKTRKSATEQLTMRDLVDRDRAYLLVVKADGIPIKSFWLETKGGRLLRLEQCRMGFEPHAEFIAPRFIESRGESSSPFLVTDAYWVRRSGERRSFPPSSGPAAPIQQISADERTAAHRLK